MTDPHREAFTDADEEDWARSAALLDGAVVHEPGDPDDEPVRSPEEWHATDWDSERQPPKTVDEARQALAARIADPNAPDTEDQAAAYDEEP